MRDHRDHTAPEPNDPETIAGLPFLVQQVHPRVGEWRPHRTLRPYVGKSDQHARSTSRSHRLSPEALTRLLRSLIANVIWSADGLQVTPNGLWRTY